LSNGSLTILWFEAAGPHSSGYFMIESKDLFRGWCTSHRADRTVSGQLDSQYWRPNLGHGKAREKHDNGEVEENGCTSERSIAPA
jgi:hypothetical protein